MLSILITSKARVKILTWFVTHPGERFHYRQLIKTLNLSAPSVRKELKRLEDAGLLISTREANIRFYHVNQEHFLYQDIKNIIFKTVGIADFLREALQEIGNVEVAFIYGSVAKNVEDVKSDIDLMVIGDVDMDKLHDAVGKAEDSLGREINFTVFDPAEWRKRVQKKQSFVMDVLKNPKIYLIGDEDVVRRLS